VWIKKERERENQSQLASKEYSLSATNVSTLIICFLNIQAGLTLSHWKEYTETGQMMAKANILLDAHASHLHVLWNPNSDVPL
jgi:hypothetical protein